MKKILLFAATFCLLATFTPAEARDALKDRRTLFASFGQRDVVLEAPRLMCFLDRTQKAEAAIFQQFFDQIRKKKRGQLIALFTPCLEIAALTQSEDQMPLRNMGAVIWATPHRDDALALPARDYIDLREAGFANDTRRMLRTLDNVNVDSMPTRQDDVISLGYTAEFDITYEKHILSGVDAATVINGEPVDISITHFGPHAEDVPNLRPLMKTFVMQQHELNHI